VDLLFCLVGDSALTTQTQLLPFMKILRRIVSNPVLLSLSKTIVISNVRLRLRAGSLGFGLRLLICTNALSSALMASDLVFPVEKTDFRGLDRYEISVKPGHPKVIVVCPKTAFREGPERSLLP
jgi:hypothetical protein